MLPTRAFFFCGFDPSSQKQSQSLFPDIFKKQFHHAKALYL